MFGVQEDNFDLQSSDITIVGNSKVIKKTKDLKLSKSINLKNGRIEKKRSTDIKVLSSALVSIAEKRDREAFRAIYNHYAPRVKSYLIKQGATVVSAEELSQETLMSVWRKADRYDPQKASAGTWIFTIARNLRIDSLRKENRPQFDPNDPSFLPEHETPPDDNIAISETRDLVSKAIKELPAEQADVIRLSFYSDKAHTTIANELGIPLGTVKSRMRLAMKKLTILLGDKS